MSSIILSILIVGGLGLIFGILLAWLSKRFAVNVDHKMRIVLDTLPGSNCGACGWAGCSSFAEALIKGEASIDGCAPGGEEVRRRIAQLLGIEAEAREKRVAVILCSASQVNDRFTYDGVDDCRAAFLLFEGMKECRYGCLGLASCVDVCRFDAIRMDGDLPVIDPELCTGCGRCLDVCPKDLITLVPSSKKVVVRCASNEIGRLTNKVCEVGCIACGKCEKVCEFGAITVRDNLARIDYAKCTNCGRCVEVCPNNTIQSIEKAVYEKA